MQVHEAMTSNPVTIGPEASIQQAAAAMRSNNVGMLPVCADQKLIGLITDRDIVVECVATDSQPAACRVSDHMTANPILISPRASVEKAIEVMGQEQVRRLCVVEDGRLVGVLALGDIAAKSPETAGIAAALTHISLHNWHLGAQRVHV